MKPLLRNITLATFFLTAAFPLPSSGAPENKEVQSKEFEAPVQPIVLSTDGTCNVGCRGSGTYTTYTTYTSYEQCCNVDYNPCPPGSDPLNYTFRPTGGATERCYFWY